MHKELHPKYHTGMGLFVLFIGVLTVLAGAVLVSYPSVSWIPPGSLAIVGLIYFALSIAEFVDTVYLFKKDGRSYDLTNIVLIWDIALKCYTLLYGYQLGVLFLISLTLICLQLAVKLGPHRE